MDKGHGRIEKRTLELTTWLEDYLGDDWPGCRQVFRLQRERRTGEKVEVEVVFGITSLSRERAGAAKLLDAVRAGTISRHIICSGQLFAQFFRSHPEELPEAQRGQLQAQEAVRRLILSVPGPELV